MLAYVFDDKLRQTLNRNGINYWDVYIQEINELLGARCKPLSIQDLDTLDQRDDIKTLILGRQSGENLTDPTISALEKWVKKGGILIGFAVEGLDEVFGIKFISKLKQTPDDYTISGYFDLRPHQITHEIHPTLFNEQRLLILSDIQLVERKEAIELGRMCDITGHELNHPAITWNRYGNGYAGYFNFDVAKTVWLLHQGKPTSHIPENRGHPRMPEMTVLGENSRKIPYADEICFILQNMLAQNPQPFIYQIPPKEGKVPDALLYWGGDEYVGPTELSLTASDWMRQQGLPYHINIQQNHPMTAEELRHILDNGHEISLFYYTLAENNFAMTEDLYLSESDAFYKVRGFRPCVTVNSVTRWNHWAEPAKWMRKAGGQADNSFGGSILPYEHPAANGSFFGFGFGTSYPFYFYDDYRSENKRIDYMEQPIICYEIGHRGSLLDLETDMVTEVHFPLQMAVKYHLVMNMFYHPIYISRYPLCRKAIEEIVDYIRHIGANVVHMGNDAVAHWWKARSNSTLEHITVEPNSVSFESDCPYPEGMIVKFLLKRSVYDVQTDDRFPTSYQIRKEFAGSWIYLIVASGKHRIKIRYE